MPRHIYGDEGLGSPSGVVTSLPVGYALGEERVRDNIKYQLVYNNGNSAIEPGNLCISTSVVANQTLYSVTLTSVTESVAGIRGCCHHATVATGSYFWMVRHGHPVNLMASNISIATAAKVGPAAAGKVVTTDTAANYVGYNVGDAASATATTDAIPTNGRFFVWFDELASGGRHA